MSKSRSRFRPFVESLEHRLVPYALTGYQWTNPSLVTFSFAPDGTSVGSQWNNAPNALFSYMNNRFGTSTWQLQYAKALQTWAAYAPLNFRLVSDNGAAAGSSGSYQGDSRFGDIRIFAFPHTGDNYLSYTYYPTPGYTLSGDSFLNTNYAFYIGSDYDLFSNSLHEFGHSLGMAHSSLSSAVMYATYHGIVTGLISDDIAGIQAIYGARPADQYDAAASNDSFATATAISLNGSGAATLNADLTTMTDLDYYRFVAPSSGNGTATFTLDAGDFSLLTPSLTVYDSAGNQVATTSATSYGQTLTLNLSGLTPGQAYVVKVAGATTDVFSIGAYRLSTAFGGVSPPPPPPPSADCYEADDTSGTAHSFGTSGSLNCSNLTLHTSSDVDYYTVTVNRSATYQFATAFSQYNGSGGTVQLSVLNANLGVLASTVASNGSESVTVSLSSGQRIYIQVTSPSTNLFTYCMTMTRQGGGHGGHQLAVGDGFPKDSASADADDIPVAQGDAGAVVRLPSAQTEIGDTSGRNIDGPATVTGVLNRNTVLVAAPMSPIYRAAVVTGFGTAAAVFGDNQQRGDSLDVLRQPWSPDTWTEAPIETLQDETPTAPSPLVPMRSLDDSPGSSAWAEVGGSYFAQQATNGFDVTAPASGSPQANGDPVLCGNPGAAFAGLAVLSGGYWAQFSRENRTVSRPGMATRSKIQGR
jgi:hypothetical protein